MAALGQVATEKYLQTYPQRPVPKKYNPKNDKPSHTMTLRHLGPSPDVLYVGTLLPNIHKR